MAELRKRNPVSDSVRKSAYQKEELEKVTQVEDLVHTGSTLLNLACSDRYEGGYNKGKVVNLIGESSSGKTILALTCLAECANNPKLDEYDLYLDDAEHALEFNIANLFGKKAADRIKSPYYSEDGEAKPSETIEEFYLTVLNKIQSGKPFIYVLDSLDSLTSDPELERAYKAASDQAKGNEAATESLSASYKQEKAKMASEILRVINAKLKRTSSILIIISQTRDNIGSVGYGPKKTRSGGRALKFYCTHEIWLSNVKTLKAKDRVIGHSVQAKVSKNKITGKEREVQFNVYYSYGVDDISSCCNFLASEGKMKKRGTSYTCAALGINDLMLLNEIVKHIEKDAGRIKALRAECGKTWNSIEEALKLNRKPRFI